MRKITVIIFAAALVAALSACQKVELDCLLRIKPYVQQADMGEVTAATQTIAYVFYADSSQWAVKDYASAEAGVLTSRTGSGTKSFDMKALPKEAGSLLFERNITSAPAIIVVCDTESKIYAWQQVAIPAGLETVTISVNFRTWKPVSTYKEGKWFMVVEFPPAEPQPEEEEPGEEV